MHIPKATGTAIRHYNLAREVCNTSLNEYYKPHALGHATSTTLLPKNHQFLHYT